MEVDPSYHTAVLIQEGFQHYLLNFHIHTDNSPRFYKMRDWAAKRENQRKRLRLYKDQVSQTKTKVLEQIGLYASDFFFWKETKGIYSRLIAGRKEKELAETFFNSVIRKTYPGLAIDEALMFVHEGFNSCDLLPSSHLFHTYSAKMGLVPILRKILADFDFGAPLMDPEADIRYLERAVKEIILTRYRPDENTITQIWKSIFFTGKSAYLIGRTRLGGKWMPFIIPFLYGSKGVFVDTLIFDPILMSGLFSYTRSYFMVKVDVPSQLVSFLNSVIPNKKIHELYNSIGFNKHGKTEFYRDLLNHLAHSDDQFVIAEGIKGMVMTVFTLPSYNIVFKMIKDYFDPPKTMTRQEVREKYKLVGLHDRVGRMADTHEFEEFHLPLRRIHPDLMQELRSTVNSLLEIRGEELILKHVYIERRMTPLNIYLDNCSLEEAKQVVEDYGNAITELAQANIFPGDMMVKNFGVTRQKRVIFYDYDEIEFVTDMNFRAKPKPENYEQIYSPEPWYEIGPRDVFPEDFKRFMIGRADIREYFFEVHSRLFDPMFWQSIQKNIRSGEMPHAFSYPRSIRFRPNELV